MILETPQKFLCSCWRVSPKNRRTSWIASSAFAKNSLLPLRRCHYSTFTYPVPRALNEIAKVQLLQQRDPLAISEMWRIQYSDRLEIVTAVMSGDEYNIFSANIRKSPMFILPIDKGKGSFFNLVLQFAAPKSILCTSVDSFKARGLENSEPYLILTLFDELLKTKGVVLARGDVINTKDVTKANAQNALENTIKFYTDFNLYQWVLKFNHNSQEFDFQEFKRRCNHLFQAVPPLHN